MMWIVLPVVIWLAYKEVGREIQNYRVRKELEPFAGIWNKPKRDYRFFYGLLGGAAVFTVIVLVSGQ